MTDSCQIGSETHAQSDQLLDAMDPETFHDDADSGPPIWKKVR